MRTLIYKPTHPGDPDRQGRFGIEDCMGHVRRWGFEAVIGVGGIGAESRSHGRDGKVNWIGIGPHTTGYCQAGAGSDLRPFLSLRVRRAKLLKTGPSTRCSALLQERARDHGRLGRT